VSLRRLCHQLHRTRIALGEPGVESYGSRLRDELLAIEQFDTLLEAQVLIGDWRVEYNTYRPHSALNMLTPAEFADHWRQTNHPSSH
jgi:transposase InsO family protein